MTLVLKGAILAGTALAAALAAPRLMNMYTIPPKWAGYETLGRSYLAAGANSDTAALRTLTGSDQAFNWAREAGATHPEEVRVWSKEMFATSGGNPVGDTIIVNFTSSAKACVRSELMLWIVGGRQGKVVQATSYCLHDPEKR